MSDKVPFNLNSAYGYKFTNAGHLVIHRHFKGSKYFILDVHTIKEFQRTVTAKGALGTVGQWTTSEGGELIGNVTPDNEPFLRDWMEAIHNGLKATSPKSSPFSYKHSGLLRSPYFGNFGIGMCFGLWVMKINKYPNPDFSKRDETLGMFYLSYDKIEPLTSDSFDLNEIDPVLVKEERERL